MVSLKKLKLKKNESKTIYTYSITEDKTVDIEVKNYLPVAERLDLIGNSIANCFDGNKFYNLGKLNVFLTIDIIKHYTNINFTEEELSNIPELYDLLESNGIVEGVFSILADNNQLDYLFTTATDTLEAIYKYEYSLGGLMEDLSSKYDSLNEVASDVEKQISDEQNLTLLKDIMTKLG